MDVGKNHNCTLCFWGAAAALTLASLAGQSARAGQLGWPAAFAQAAAGASVSQLDSEPEPIFILIPEQPVINVPFRVDASQSFDRPSNGPITNYLWTWGDGTPISNGVSPQHTYTQAGRFTITLTVFDANNPPNAASNSRSVSISATAPPPDGGANRAPLASLSIAPAQGDPGEEITFDAGDSSDLDSDPLVYRFNFGDGNETDFDSDPVVTHAYDEPGTYTVRLTVRDDLNASTDLTSSVKILGPDSTNQAPVAVIATGPRTGAAPVTLNFDGRLSYDLDGDALAYNWIFSRDGVPYDEVSGSVVNQLFSEPGPYSVVLEVSDGDGANNTSAPQTVTISEPGVPVEPPPPAPVPEPEPPPPSHAQRPDSICGIGMLMPMLACLMGLVGWRRFGRISR